jgi:hypothetical protein
VSVKRDPGPKDTPAPRSGIQFDAAEASTMSDRDEKPQSLDQPWWLGKAKRQHILLKFVVICVVIALLILGIAIIAVR